MLTSGYLALIGVKLENEAVKQKSTVIEKSNTIYCGIKNISSRLCIKVSINYTRLGSVIMKNVKQTCESFVSS